MNSTGQINMDACAEQFTLATIACTSQFWQFEVAKMEYVRCNKEDGVEN